MEAERDAYVGAEPFERAAARRTQRTGYKPRTLRTRVGSLKSRVPQTRDGRFYPSLLKRHRRSERPSVTALVECRVQGVGTRKLASICDELFGEGLGHETVSRYARELDAELEPWRARPLEGSYPYLMLILGASAPAPPPFSARIAARPQASLVDLRWLAGHWTGRGLGATAENTWLPPAGGAMAGVFRLVRDGTVELYERVVHVEEVGWEAKHESVRFPLVRRDDATLWFDGLTVTRVGPHHMKIWAALRSREDEVTEELFEYRRAVR